MVKNPPANAGEVVSVPGSIDTGKHVHHCYNSQAKPWKQPKYPSTDEWIKKIYFMYNTHIHTHTYVYIM